MKSAFTVTTADFEGPLDLLLTLIERKKLGINDVALSEIADDYIAYIKTVRDFPLSHTAHFILIASTLVLIKSLSLMPSFELTQEEESSIEELESRLKQYKQIKDLSQKLKTRLDSSARIYAGKGGFDIEPRFSPTDEISLNSIKESIAHLLQTLPSTETLSEKIIEKVMTLQEAVEGLTQRVRESIEVSFSKLSNQTRNMSKEDRIHVIVNFLAMLELVKDEIVDVMQDEKFSDITITRTTIEIA